MARSIQLRTMAFASTHILYFPYKDWGNTLCGSAVVRAIANTPTRDDATDSLFLRFLLWYKLHAAVDANAILCYSAEWMLLATFGGS